MRYMIQFADRTSIIVPQKDGEAAGKALASGKSIILRGSYVSPHFVSIIKPIKKGWFAKDFIERQERIEKMNADEMKFLPSPE